LSTVHWHPAQEALLAQRLEGENTWGSRLVLLPEEYRVPWSWSPLEVFMPALTSPAVFPILLLVVSNLFMTLAWYGHLRFKEVPLHWVILASWGIAFFEYCLAVPANRIGHEVYSAAELKTIQEVITLVVFALFSVVYLKEQLTWNHAIGFALIAAGAFFIFQKN
jgi:uncharacterized protein (DUF486 family)